MINVYIHAQKVWDEVNLLVYYTKKRAQLYSKCLHHHHR